MGVPRNISEPQQQDSHDFYQGFFFRTSDLDVTFRGYSARILWMLGFPDQALDTIQEALTLAQKLDSPYRMAQSQISAAVVHKFRRERQAALKQADGAIALAIEYGFPLWMTLGNIFKGWAMVDQFLEHRIDMAHAKEGIEQTRRGLASLRRKGIEVLIPTFLVTFAESYGNIGRFEDGINLLNEAEDLMQASGACFNQPEVYRLKGELVLLLADSRAEAETCFLKALQVARQQGAKSLELRAAVSLARLWQKQGNPEQARNLLSEIYGWFREGFDTSDLKEAKTLLRNLSGRSS